MPKTLLEKIVFTVVMAAIMVYGMIVYNVALATGGVTNALTYAHYSKPFKRRPRHRRRDQRHLWHGPA